MDRRLRIALVAPPFLPIPPPGYAGTERVVAMLAQTLHVRGHRVTVFCSGDSDLPCEVVPVVPEAVWHREQGWGLAWVEMTVARAWEQATRFDLIHSHVDSTGFLMARYGPTPVVTTLHGRLDTDGLADLIDVFPEIPLIAISESQRRWNPDANWVATIHHGLDFSNTPMNDRPGDYLLFVGRITPEKGIAEAIEVARRSQTRLVMAAKVHEQAEQALFDEVVKPAIDDGVVDWRGELGGEERDQLMAGALATLMLGAWPEPFGLVAVESMATGTPVIARRAGACTETVTHGESGFTVDDVTEAVLAVARVSGLDRAALAAQARQRFSVERMVDDYEAAYDRVLQGGVASPTPAQSVGRRHEAVPA
jgi:glycosyltransferase involved in cell wall biosynthesis